MKSPLYSRIQEAIRAPIIAGRYRPGDRLPSESELAETFGTTRMTVRQALAQLTFDGLIVRQMGRGTFVADRRVESRLETRRPRAFEEQAEDAGNRVAFRLLGFDCEPASDSIAAALGIASGDLVYRLHRLRLVNEEVISIEDRHMRAQLGSAIPATALTRQSAVTMVETALGAPLGGMKVVVGTILPATEIARLLGIARNVPVLVRTHTFFAPGGEPVLVGESIYRGDKYQFTYSFGNGGG